MRLRRARAYQVVPSEKSTFVGSREFPEQTDRNEGRQEPDHHDNSADILELGRNIGTSEHENRSTSAVGNAVGCSQKGIVRETLDNELAEVGNAAVDDLVEQDVEEE